MKSAITTHVLDTSSGAPAENILVVLEAFREGENWETIGEGHTDSDGRINNFSIESDTISAGAYRLTFHVSSFFKSNGVDSFYTSIPIMFNLDDPSSHYHVPLLLNPYGYSTYRGR